MIEAFLADVRFALRWLRRSPGFTAVAVASFAIGIGFNAALFTVVDALLFRPLPVREPGRLVDVFTSSNHDRYATTSYPDLIDLEARNGVFEDMLGFSPMFAALNVGDHSRLVSGEVVTGNYFRMLGVNAAIGRALAPSDDRPGAARVLMVSDAFWRREMGADPAAAGRQVRLRGLPYTVVGVAPRGFAGMLPILAADLWVPTVQVEEINAFGITDYTPSPTGNTPLEQRGNRWLFVKGRLRAGATPEQARANLDLVMRALTSEYPQTNRDRRISVVRTSDVHVHPEANQILGAVGTGLMVLVGLVMLVGCANVASMLLARAAARRREIGIRLAIGASRGRLVRQMLTESLVLASLGGAVGTGLAWLLVRTIAAVSVPIPIPISVNLPLDGRVLAFTALATGLAALVAGLVPALRSSRTNLAGDIRGDLQTAGGRRRRLTLRDALVAGQIAVTMLLLVCGGLLVRSVVAAQNARLGFRTDGIAILSTDLQMARYDAARSREFFERVVDKARGIPGVQYVSVGSTLPFGVGFNNATFFIPGHDQPGRPGASILQTDVGADYFRVLGIPLLEGRFFDAADTPDEPAVAIVNQAMARRYWPGESAVGKLIRLRTADGPPVRIVGVCADYKVRSVGETSSPYVHMSYNQRRTTYGSLLVRTRGDAEALLAQLQREILALEPNVVFLDHQTMTRQVASTLFPVLAGAWLVGVVAIVTMALAAIGLYGVIAYSVARRSREMGIRMALGAKPASILGLVMTHGFGVALGGIAVGSLAAAAAARLLASALYGIRASDIGAWLGAAVVILAASALANFVPARRAAAVDPTVALRAE